MIIKQIVNPNILKYFFHIFINILKFKKLLRESYAFLSDNAHQLLDTV